MLSLSQAASVQASRIREIALLAERFPGTLRLFYGEDTRPTPEPIIEAGRSALAEHKTFYAPNAGYAELREAISARYRQLSGVEIDSADRVVVTASGSVALLLTIQSTIDPGDEAIVISPLWPNVREMVRVRGGTPVEVPLDRDSDGRFRLDFDRLAAAVTPRTKLIALASPSNPSGWTATAEDWRTLGQLCADRDLWLLADTVYDRLVYDGSKAAPCPLASIADHSRLWVAQSFSKAYRMTGWRVGWLVTPPGLWATAAKLQEFVVSHAAGFSQDAARFALEHGEGLISEMVSDYRANRDLAVERLSRLPGVSLASPEGAFYLFPKCDGLRDTFDFCERLVREYGVGVAPGMAFGPGGEGHVRICFAVDRGTLAEALDRFERAWTSRD
ncbi:aminotransferase class I/II-fold pyridoxal phosphate-dependent enzyme [bacterium]|nr:aminotransferase class I/II-fold pyridoxal phosphate-dependent enzyme [bacterium]